MKRQHTKPKRNRASDRFLWIKEKPSTSSKVIRHPRLFLARPPKRRAELIELSAEAVKLYKTDPNEYQQLKTVGTKRPITGLHQVLSSNPKSSGPFYLPVVRYPGLYYKKSSTKYCGTFYYVEPQSRVLLNLGANVVIFGSKVEAGIRLREQVGKFLLLV
jgi:hypothetical protein